jgi:hypothetical protein
VKKALFFCMTVLFTTPCYGAVSRDDIVNFSLDYHEEKRVRDTRQLEIEQEQQEIMQARRERSKQIWERRKGKVKKFLDDLHWMVEVSETYNDNIYQTPRDKKSDLITEAMLSVDYISKVSQDEKTKLDTFFSFKGNLLGYSSNDDEDSGNFLLRGGLNYRFAPKYAVLVDYNLNKTQSTAQATVARPDPKIIDYWIHRYGGKFTASWGRLPWDVRYYHQYTSYESGYESSESEKDNYEFTGYVKMLPKTDFLYEYDYGDIQYPNKTGKDYTFNKYLLGVRGRLAPKLLGVTKFGWGTYDYEDGKEKDMEEISLSLIYNLSERLLFNFDAERSISETTIVSETSSTTKTSWDLRCKYFPPFNKKLILSAGISLDNTEQDSGTEDDVFGLKVRADYGLMKNVKIAFSYELKDKESDDPGREYTQNIFSLKGAIDF